MRNLSDTIIAAILSSFGAIAGAIITKYGLPNFPEVYILPAIGAIIGVLFAKYLPDFAKRKILKCEGEIFDTDIENNEDFSSAEHWKYELDEVTIIIKAKSLSFKFSLVMTLPDNTMIHGEMIGEGTYIDNLGFVEYVVKAKEKPIDWKGVMLLRFPKIGPISGYWLTSNLADDNKIELGKIVFCPK